MSIPASPSLGRAAALAAVLLSCAPAWAGGGGGGGGTRTVSVPAASVLVILQLGALGALARRRR